MPNFAQKGCCYCIPNCHALYTGGSYIKKENIFPRGVKCYLDTKPEKTRLCLQKLRTSCFAFITFVDSLVGTIMRVFLGAFCIIFSLPQNNWRTICRP